MPLRKPTGRPNGRPCKHIDWELVDKLLMAGCTGTQICPHFDISAENFYARVEKEKGIGFTQYCHLKRDKGDSILLAKQFEKALKGDNSMLIWLGKNRLKQRENPVEDSVPQSTKDQFELLMSVVRQLQQESELKRADIKNKADIIS